MATKDYDPFYNPYEGYGDTQHFLQNALNGEDDGTPTPPPLPGAPPPPPSGAGAGATGYQDYVTRNQGRNPLDIISGAYTEFLGRPAGPGEAELHYGPRSTGYARGGLPGGVGEIYNSPESVAYRNRAATTPPPTTGGGGSGTPGVDVANPYTGGAAASTRAPRLIQRGDQWVLTEHGNERPLQPNEVDSARNYVTQFANQNPTGFIQAGSPGYDPTQATTNAGYPTTTGTTGGGTTGGGTTGTGRTGFGGVSLDPRTGGTSGAWGGFNTERALGGGDPKSIKDAFYRFGQGFNFDPTGKSKEDIEAFIRTQLPAATTYGLNIMDVRGDQIKVATSENPEGTWVDVVGNAGGQGASPWQWIDQSYLGDTGGGGGGTTGGGGGQYQAAFQNLIGNRTPNYATLQALEPELNKLGIKLVHNASHTGADIQLPTGEIVDVIAGQTGPSGGTSWQWLTGNGGGGGGTTGGGGGGGGAAGQDFSGGFSSLYGGIIQALQDIINGKSGNAVTQSALQQTLNR